MSLEEILGCEDRVRPKFSFTSDHPEYATHLYIVEAMKSRKVAVPIGPSIRRRDRKATADRQSCQWEEAFDVFMGSHSVRDKEIMQILHECRDSRDDHFTNRANARRKRDSRRGFGLRELYGSFGSLTRARNHLHVTKTTNVSNNYQTIVLLKRMETQGNRGPGSTRQVEHELTKVDDPIVHQGLYKQHEVHDGDDFLSRQRRGRTKRADYLLSHVGRKTVFEDTQIWDELKMKMSRRRVPEV
ncbi:hypothetical protein GG344DRAFT_69473 [Lentinula edodes]|nr:hypothetical protein GG344DRAFT_69473 [Lentinula edodes]